MSDSLQSRLQEIEINIANAARASGRNREDVLLLAVTKTWPPAVVQSAYDMGLRHFGENYTQEALEKKHMLRGLSANWHFIGHLQSNKAKDIVGEFALIHSVDRMKLAREISLRTVSKPEASPQDILIEVNIANEESKSGVSLEELPKLLEEVQALPAIVVRGLTIMPPLSWPKEESRRAFNQIRDERDRLASQVSAPHNLLELSMGTSHDYVEAIHAGATIVRIGTALFGERG